MECDSLIEERVVIPPAGTIPEQQKAADEIKLKYLKAKNYLFQAIDRSILEKVIVWDTAKDIWDSMRQKYQCSNKVKRDQLRALCEEFENLSMKIDESLKEYLERMLAIARWMFMVKNWPM